MSEVGNEVNLAEFAEQRPEVAQSVFVNVEGALQAVLPGSDTHERYGDIEEVGLAWVVARDVDGRSYNPFEEGVLEKLSFLASNLAEHTGAWTPKAADQEVLGGLVPAELGRFTTYALAKVNSLTQSTYVRSHDPNQAAIVPGVIGVAGGQWRLGSLIGVSGLWEVHDDLVGTLFAHEMVGASEADGQPRSSDDIAATLEPILDGVKSLHAGVPAADLSREQVRRLLLDMDDLTGEHLPRGSEAKLILPAEKAA